MGKSTMAMDMQESGALKAESNLHDLGFQSPRSLALLLPWGSSGLSPGLLVEHQGHYFPSAVWTDRPILVP